ncbi:MAG: T9SS type A sorting domain-containing protein [Saprospiraceae bacterium]|nr:T9SS type A sorting domain-containing protein [Saprospiraceae bacterium]
MRQHPSFLICFLLLPFLSYAQPDCHNVLSAGLVAENQTICAGEMPQMLIESEAPSGGAGALEYGWVQLHSNPNGIPQWEIITGANGASYQPQNLSVTSFFIREARRAGCINWLSGNVIVVNVLPAGDPACAAVTGVQEQSDGRLETVKCFPDPFVEQLNIQNTAERPVSLQVFNFSGTKMAEKEVPAGASTNLDTSSWPSGLYVVKMVDDRGGKRTLPLVKR